jgi:predicted lipoprotein with Yx(FWY)xxD motif
MRTLTTISAGRWRRLALGLALAAGLWAGPYAPANAQSAPTVGTRDAPGLGTILTDSAGMALYRYTPDAPGVSTCYGGCAAAWPPLLVQGDPIAPDGLGGTLGTTTRQDGSQQLTFNGMPLYRYAADTEPDDVYGQGVGNVWFVVNPSPPAAASDPSLAAGSDSTGAAASDTAAAAAQPAPAPMRPAATPAPMRQYKPPAGRGW